MSDVLTLEAEKREVQGKGASRRLRKQELVPGIVYGQSFEPINIQVQHKEILRASQNKDFFSHLVSLKIGRKTYKVMVKDLQRHVYKNKVLHVDFQNINDKDVVSFELPLTFLNADSAKGVKLGGQLTISKKSILVRCKAKDIPDHVEVDLSSLEINQILHLSDIKLPKGVTSYDLMLGSDHDLAIASIHKAGGSDSSEETQEPAAAE